MQCTEPLDCKVLQRALAAQLSTRWCATCRECNIMHVAPELHQWQERWQSLKKPWLHNVGASTQFSDTVQARFILRLTSQGTDKAGGLGRSSP